MRGRVMDGNEMAPPWVVDLVYRVRLALRLPPIRCYRCRTWVWAEQECDHRAERD